MEKVSVIIPVYNGEKYIKESINSVLNQTYPNIEIVVIDDCSVDKTKDVIFKNFKDLIGKKIIYHRNEKNRERVYSRNKGVEVATGKYIYFLDYDDIYTKEYIEKSIQYLKDNDIVYSIPRTFIDFKGDILRVSKKRVKPLEELIFSGNIGYPSASAFKRENFIRYKEEYLFREDWEIFIRAYIKGLKIKILDENLVYMREHQNRTSRNIKFLKATLKVYNDYLNKIPNKYKPIFRFHTGEVALRYGDLLNGWKMIILAIMSNPSLLKNNRLLLSVLKRGFRIDRAIKYYFSN